MSACGSTTYHVGVGDLAQRFGPSHLVWGLAAEMLTIFPPILEGRCARSSCRGDDPRLFLGGPHFKYGCGCLGWQRDPLGSPAPSPPLELGCRVEQSLGSYS